MVNRSSSHFSKLKDFVSKIIALHYIYLEDMEETKC